MNGLYLAMVMIGVSKAKRILSNLPDLSSQSFLAPMGAGAQATAQGWRWCYRTLGIAITIIFVLFLFLYEETKYDPAIHGLSTLTPATTNDDTTSKQLKGSESAPRSKVLPVLDQPSVLEHELDHDIPLKSWRERLAFYTYTPESIWPHFYRPFVVLFTFPAVLFTGLQYASGVVWLTVMASVLGLVLPLPPYTFLPAQVGYMSAGPFIGNLLGSLYGGFLADRAILFYSRRNKGLFEPEMRLYILHLPALSMAGGIIMFGVTLSRVSTHSAMLRWCSILTTSLQGMHWILPSIAGALFGFGLGSIGDASLTFVIDSYREVSMNSPGKTRCFADRSDRSLAMLSPESLSFAMPSALAFPLPLFPG